MDIEEVVVDLRNPNISGFVILPPDCTVDVKMCKLDDTHPPFPARVLEMGSGLHPVGIRRFLRSEAMSEETQAKALVDAGYDIYSTSTTTLGKTHNALAKVIAERDLPFASHDVPEFYGPVIFHRFKDIKYKV